MSAAVEIPQDQEIGAARGDLVAQAAQLVVTDQATANEAGRLVTLIRELRARVAETFGPIVAAAHAAHRTACEKRAEHDDPLLRAERALKDRIGAWTLAEQRRRREEEARAAAEARKRDEEARLAEAVALEQAGEPEAAQQALEAPAMAPPPPAAPVKPKVAGVSVREVWVVEVKNLLELVQAVAAGEAPLSFVAAVETAITKYVTATDGQKIPAGCVARKAPVTSARGR